YGTQKKANLTGAVATVDVARVMDSRPVQDVTKALQGTVPGLTITNTDGGIASGSSISIRGVGTMSNGQNASPLIIIDGVASDDLAYLNPEDIQDISVLKDASSASIYGSRAAFGVILITTKNANTKEKVKISYSNNFAWSGATTYPHMALNSECIEASLQAYARTGSGLNTEVSGMNYLKLLPYVKAWEQQHGNKGYTDYVELKPFESWDNVGDYAKDPETGQWYHYAMWDVNKTLFNNAAPSSKHNVAIEGTSGKTQYRMSFGYDAKQGLYTYNPDHMHRYMANMSVSTELFSFLKAGARMNFSQRQYDDTWTNRYAYEYVWRWPSFEEGYGYITDPTTGERYGTRNDITDRLQGNPDQTRTRQMRLQAWMDATILPELILHADFTYDIRNMRSAYSNPQYTFINWNWGKGDVPYSNLYVTPAAAENTYAQNNSSESTRWTMNVYATYAKTFAQNHNLKVMVGANAEEYKYDQYSARRYNLLDNSKPGLVLTDGLTYDKDGNPQYTHMTIGGSMSNSATAGFFGRINYDYKGIYLFEANGRYDGSSRFPADDQWAFFPSFSAGYRFTEEAYWNEQLKNILSNGKLRFSWGQVGNEAIGSNMFISTISSPSSVNWLNGGGSGLIKGQGMPSVVSSTLTWERIQTTDIGLDLGFLNNSLNLTFDWYSRTTRDMLAPGAQLPQTLGATAPYQNSGRLRTNGWELALNWNHSFGDAQVFATFAIGDAKTKVTKWQNENLTLYSYRIGSGSNTNRLYEGQTYGDIWGMEFDRFFEVNDFTGKNEDGEWVLKQGVPSQEKLEYGNFKYGPGDVKYVDQNGDGVINCGTEDPGVGKRAAYIAAHPEAAKFLKDPKLAPDDPKQGWWPVASMHNHGDLKVVGNAMPRYEYSFRLGGAWKGFDIDLFFQGVGKRKFYMINNFVLMQAQGNGNPLYKHQIEQGFNKYIYDPETFEITGYEIDQNNLYPVIYPGNFGYNTRYRQTLDQGINNWTTTDRYLTNMAYLRLKTATVGYTLPAEITKHALIERARIYFSCENPFFIYNGAGKFGMDPELSTSARGQASAAGVGAMGRTNPMMRTYSFGIQVTF
ncbi:MAG: SusC/RagA family TonB-linked outer membrane protein, partial [Muribaculaceae bacterium]